MVRENNMHLNPEKCFFVVEGDKFLGFMIIQREIEVNPNKCEVILSLRIPSIIKKVQRLNNKLVALSRFIHKLAEKERPFFKLLKVKQKFEWSKKM